MAAEKGSTNRADGKRFELALHQALTRKNGQDKWAALTDLAEKLIDEGLSGNITAIREVADRFDGKPAQSVAVTGADGGPLLVQVVKFADNTNS